MKKLQKRIALNYLSATPLNWKFARKIQQLKKSRFKCFDHKTILTNQEILEGIVIKLSLARRAWSFLDLYRNTCMCPGLRFTVRSIGFLSPTERQRLNIRVYELRRIDHQMVLKTLTILLPSHHHHRHANNTGTLYFRIFSRQCVV